MLSTLDQTHGLYRELRQAIFLKHIIQYNKQFILHQLSNRIVTQKDITILTTSHKFNLHPVCWCKQIFSLFTDYSRRAAFVLTCRALYNMGVAF